MQFSFLIIVSIIILLIELTFETTIDFIDKKIKINHQQLPFHFVVLPSQNLVKVLQCGLHADFLH